MHQFQMVLSIAFLQSLLAKCVRQTKVAVSTKLNPLGLTTILVDRLRAHQMGVDPLLNIG
jgi:hypothetical protein